MKTSDSGEGGFPALDRRASRQRRKTDQAWAICDVIARAELLEMTSHLRGYLEDRTWDIDPPVRREASNALAWLTDRGVAPLVMRIGAGKALMQGWPRVFEDLHVYQDARDLDLAEKTLPGNDVPMDVNTHERWERASKNARLLASFRRRTGLGSFLEAEHDELLDSRFLPPSGLRHQGPWAPGNRFIW